jgi:hypothetical protein
MCTDSIAEWPDVWNVRIGWAMPFPSMVQLRSPHHSANISPSNSSTSLGGGTRGQAPRQSFTPEQGESLEGWLFDELVADC